VDTQSVPNTTEIRYQSLSRSRQKPRRDEADLWLRLYLNLIPVNVIAAPSCPVFSSGKNEPMTELRERRLSEFVRWVTDNVTGDEKGEAQIFLDRLFQGFGQPGCLDVGGTPEFRIRKSKEDGAGTAFADYVWKPLVLIEMKKRGVDLRKHFRQAFDYWTRLVPNRPRYVVLCNFDEFHIYDFETQMDSPVDEVRLTELPERYGPLAFLFKTLDKPVFRNDQESVTREAADRLVTCFQKLTARKVEHSLAQRFILQMLVALFAEDIGLLDKYCVARLLAASRRTHTTCWAACSRR
jgi:hypothetical protein